MAFHARDGANTLLQTALTDIVNVAREILSQAEALRDLSAAGDVTGRGIVIYMDNLQQQIDLLDTLSGTAGIVAYAQDQYDDVTYDVVTEFNTMKTAAEAVVAWIDTNIPKNGVWLLVEEIVLGRLTPRMFTTTDTAGLRTELDALILTID